MARYAALAVPTGGIPQDLDLDTLELFCHFFSLEELITTFQLLGLSVRELTVLKAAVHQEMARRIADPQGALRDAVRARFQAVWNALRSATTTT